MPTARQATLIVWFAGMLVLVGLTVWYGADHVGGAIISAGWAALPALGGFVLIQGERGQRLIKWVLNAVAGDRQWLTFGAIDELFARLGTLYSDRRNLIKSVVWHLGGWFVGAIEVWLVLTFMGY